jgi:hypothetical protein
VPDDERSLSGITGRDRRYPADDLIDATGVEQLAVQSERGTVVAEIQTKHRQSGSMEHCARRHDITGFSASLPAMQQDREALRFAALRAVMAQ